MILPRIKSRLVFFNRSVISTRWDRMNKNPLQRAGLLVRKIAVQSIRRGNPSSKKRTPGKNTPKSWKSGNVPPFKMIYTLPQKWGTSQMVGMVGFTQSGNPVPGLHEHGGFTKRTVMEEQFKHKNTKKTSGKYAQKTRIQVTKMVRYRPRPFMQPALNKGRNRLPMLWQGSFSKVG